MQKRTFRIVAGVGAAAIAMIGVTAGVSFAGQTPVAAPAASSSSAQADSFLGGKPDVPPAIAVPDGNVLTSVFKAHGVQNYGCNSSGAWALLEPAAVLTGLSLKPVKPATAIHFRGPSWQSDSDGSLVEGTSPVSAPSPNPNSIAQLLITAKTLDPARAQTGVFAGVTFVQRLNTKGGVAPAGACTAGQTTAVKYTADYRFFKKA
ncbi:DUF3455 domain-containing protein [Actinoplanes sp. NPDC049265]|uniref:DUF3455 domain-containing protein n=1 Tax=Actinoplanes sp. NPDC049265 TaxID=3363902 RepID=UPI003717BE54